MIETWLINPENNAIRTGNLELLSDWSGEQNSIIWLNINGELDSQLSARLEGVFGLDPLALADASRNRHPPKLERFDQHTFMLLKGLAQGSQSIDSASLQIAAFVGKRFLITRHSGANEPLQKIKAEIDANAALLAQGPDAVAIRLGRLIGVDYLRILLTVEPELEQLESTLLTENDDRSLAQLIVHKRNLTRLRRTMHYHLDMARDLHRHDTPGFRTEMENEIRDMYDQFERANSLSELYYQLAGDLIEGSISLSSHRLNHIMQTLTIITAIFVPLSFLAGIYGMNFDYIPELKIRYGYFILLGAMASITGVMLYFLRSRRWL